MRLLLLLSALFTALAGVTGARVDARPVQASAFASAPAAVAEKQASVAVASAAAAVGRVPPAQPLLTPVAATLSTWPLYAERRRE